MWMLRYIYHALHFQLFAHEGHAIFTKDQGGGLGEGGVSEDGVTLPTTVSLKQPQMTTIRGPKTGRVRWDLCLIC